MQQTTENNRYKEETIDLKDIINQLVASKKLIIIIVLLSSILAFFYSSSKPSTFTSKALIEIGHDNVKTIPWMRINESEGNFNNLMIIDSNKTLIESAEKLLRELNILFAHKKQNGIHSGALSFSIIEGRLIEIRTTAPSSEIAINSVNRITSYILDRHENIVTGNTQRNLYLINTNLEQLNSEIEFNNESKKNLLKEEYARIKSRVREIKQQLPTIDKKILALQLVINDDTNNLRLLETDLQLLKERAAIQPTLSEVIYLYKNSIFDFEFQKTNLERELIILQASLSDIEITLENKSEDSAVFSTSKLTDSQFYLNDSIYRLNERQFHLSDSIYRLNEKKFKLLQEKNIQEKNLKSLLTHTPSNSALIGEITSVQNKPNTTKFALQGFIFGAILSIVLVLIIGKFKAYKEENEITL